MKYSMYILPDGLRSRKNTEYSVDENQLFADHHSSKIGDMVRLRLIMIDA